MTLAIKLIAIVAGVAVVLIAIGAVLVWTGSPSACADHVIPVSDAARLSLQSKWDTFKADAALGPASTSFTEPEVTSRAVQFIADENLDVDNVQVYLCSEGYAEATATFTGAGPSVDFLARGTLDLTGAKPKVDVQDVKVGNMPGFIALGALLGFLPDEAKELDITGVTLTGISFAGQDVSLTGIQ